MTMTDERPLVILPLYDCLVLPHVEYQMTIVSLSDREKSALREKGACCYLAPVRTAKPKNELTGEDFYSLAVRMEDLKLRKAPAGYTLQGRTTEKASLLTIDFYDDYLEGRGVTVREKTDITCDAEEKLLDGLKGLTRELASYVKGGAFVERFLKEIDDVNTFASRFGPFFDMTPEEKYGLLATDSQKERGLLIHDALLRFKTSIELQREMSEREDPEASSYKKAAIRKQMDRLQRELDELEPEGEGAAEEDDYQALSRKVAALDLPEEAGREIGRVLKRFGNENTNSAEYASLYDYLTFVTDLKWQVEEEKTVDIKRAEKILERDHYGLKKVKERILEHLAVMALNKEKQGSILLLVGAPGTGKTSMGRSVAEALGRKYVRISLGGSRDEADIRGHRRTYIGAMPGRIMDGIRRAGTMDPVMVLDEVDKLCASLQGDPASALLEALDPEQNRTFTDHYMNVPYDLSHVVFLCTANTTESIPQPLLDRMEVIELNGYTPVEKFHIAKEHLVRQAMTENGIEAGRLKITDAALRRIISDYTMEAGVRGLKKQLDKVCRKAAIRVVSGETGRMAVGPKDLETCLGRQKLHHDRALKKGMPGVATGLAWTEAGGEILFIETKAMAGTGQVHLTGQLGDVMKESADTAMSLARAYYLTDSEDQKSRDIHIHIPEGAVPKDGPSAGITMFTALVSLMTDKPVDPTLAMTGEISLRGEVLPIGGLPEKLMAAERAGIRRVLIPKANVPDLEDVPEETKAALEIIPVSRISEVIREALGIRLPE